MSETRPIPFTASQESGSDALGGATQVAMNVVIDSKGTVRRRPGIEKYDLAPSAAIEANPVTGVFRPNTGELYATIGLVGGSYKMYRILETTSSSLGSFAGTGRPVFAETEAMLVWADGRAMNRVLFDGLKTEPLPGDTPRASHVVPQSLRLLANDVVNDRTNVNYSGTASGSATLGHEEWNEGVGASQSTSGFFSVEANPEPVIALASNSNELVAFKASLTQNFAPDASTIYSRVTTREFGCSAPYSIIRDDQSFAWIDDKRRIVHSDIRQVTPLSDPIQSTIDDISTVNDAVGYRINHGSVDALCWFFPTDGRTFAYQKGGGWSQWMSRDASSNNWSRLLVNAHFHVPGTHENIVGLNDGRIGVMKHDVTDDLGDVIHAYIQTGFISQGTDRRKQCLGARFSFRRGTGTNADTPVAKLSWRNDEGPWEGPIDIPLGRSGDKGVVVSLRGLGVYRRRQWRLEFADTEDFVFAGAEEEFEVLSH